MNNSHKGDISDENVADNWEEAGDEVSNQLEQRQEQILKRRQREEELERMRMATSELQNLDLQQQRSSGLKQPIKILKRPESYPTMASSSSTEEGKSVHKTFEEKQAAYMEARERIFGEKVDFDDEPENESCNAPIRPQHIPNPRPRAPIPRLIAMPPARYPPVPPGVPINFPPPIGISNSIFLYQPPIGNVPAFPNTHRQVAPDIISSVYATSGTYDFSTSRSSLEMVENANRPPYGRPPAQLVLQPLSQYFSQKKTNAQDGRESR